jgi:hypothetical protein
VIDKWNNLMWWDGNSVTYMDWNNAIYYCDNFTAGGYNDWRLPTVSEAFSSFDYGAKHNSGSHSCLKGITDCFGNWTKPPLWTSTNFASNTRYAYVYYPAVGSIVNTLRTGLKLARCIRFNE